MKILLCGPEPSAKGGVTIWMKLVLEYFSTNSIDGIEVTHLNIKRSVSLPAMLPTYKRLFYAVKDYIKALTDLHSALKKKEYDVVHIISAGGTGIIRDRIFSMLAKHYKAAPIVHYHCGTIPDTLSSDGLINKILHKTLTNCKKAIVLDENTFDSLCKNGYKNVIKLGNPYNPIIDKIITEEVVRIPNRVLFVGHIVPEKGIYELLKATQDIPDIEVECYGPENEAFKNELSEYIKIHPHKGHIKFNGLQAPEKIYKEMCKAALFVLPTYTEGFPFVIVEAMACGCPIISTPVGAIKEMLTYKNEIQGFLVEPRDDKGLKNQIIYCLSHKQQIEEKAALARMKANEEYSYEAIVNKLINIWKEINN